MALEVASLTRRLLGIDMCSDSDANTIIDMMAAAATERVQTAPVAALEAGDDETDLNIFSHPEQEVTVLSIGFIAQGAFAGIDDSNTCVITIKDEDGNTLVEKTYDTEEQPSETELNDLGSLDATHKILDAGELLTVTVMNGATAETPALLIVIRYELNLEI